MCPDAPAPQGPHSTVPPSSSYPCHLLRHLVASERVLPDFRAARSARYGSHSWSWRLASPRRCRPPMSCATRSKRKTRERFKAEGISSKTTSASVFRHTRQCCALAQVSLPPLVRGTERRASFRCLRLSIEKLATASSQPVAFAAGCYSSVEPLIEVGGHRLGHGCRAEPACADAAASVPLADTLPINNPILLRSVQGSTWQHRVPFIGPSPEPEASARPERLTNSRWHTRCTIGERWLPREPARAFRVVHFQRRTRVGRDAGTRQRVGAPGHNPQA